MDLLQITNLTLSVVAFIFMLYLSYLIIQDISAVRVQSRRTGYTLLFLTLSQLLVIAFNIAIYAFFGHSLARFRTLLFNLSALLYTLLIIHLRNNRRV